MMNGGMRGFGHGFLGNGYSYMNGYGGWMAFLPLILNAIFFIAIILVAVVFFRRHSSKLRTFQKQNDPALKILNERYAQGEIDTEEYNQRKRDLIS